MIAESHFIGGVASGGRVNLFAAEFASLTSTIIPELSQNRIPEDDITDS